MEACALDDTIYRVIAAWLTWRQIPVHGYLQPVVKRAHQPAVPPTQPGTYGNPPVAQAAHNVETPAYYSSSANTTS